MLKQNERLKDYSLKKMQEITLGHLNKFWSSLSQGQNSKVLFKRTTVQYHDPVALQNCFYSNEYFTSGKNEECHNVGQN